MGHRVVHGGADFTALTVVDGRVRARLEAVSELAPLHNPPALRAIDALGTVAPGVPAVACFDTAFHAGLPDEARTYALPAEWVERWGIRRYGFHGLSCEWSLRRAAALVGRPARELRLAVCHLGGGASVTAIAGGRSVDTTMGFTPAEGLVMATRPGDVDPGALAWMAEQGLAASELVEGLEHRSGLLGLTGGATGDMRQLLEAAAVDGSGGGVAQRAVAVYVHRLRGKIASMAAATGGLDVLVFTGGVGEHAPSIRAAACSGLAWMGVAVDEERNASGPAPGGDGDITAAGAAVRTLVVTAREELVVAAHCRAALARS